MTHFWEAGRSADKTVFFLLYKYEPYQYVSDVNNILTQMDTNGSKVDLQTGIFASSGFEC